MTQNNQHNIEEEQLWDWHYLIWILTVKLQWSRQYGPDERIQKYLHIKSSAPCNTCPPKYPPPGSLSHPLQNPQFVSESTVYHGLSPSLISPNSLLLSISQCSPSYSLCSTSKWNHMIIESLCLTYFTQHNLLQSHPCWYRSWVFVLSDGCIIFHCTYGPHLLLSLIHIWRCRRE